MSVTQRDRGAVALIAGLQTRGVEYVMVGVLGGDQGGYADGGGVTTADIAEWAEFGIGQPMRSWLRAWADTHEADVRRFAREELKAVKAGNRTMRQAHARMGVWIVGQIQARIAAGIEPENAPSTIAQKGSSKPLIDTGIFRASITSRVV